MRKRTTRARQEPEIQREKVPNNAAPAHVHSSHAAHKAAGAAACITRTHSHRAGPCGLRCALPSCSPGDVFGNSAHPPIGKNKKLSCSLSRRSATRRSASANICLLVCFCEDSLAYSFDSFLHWLARSCSVAVCGEEERGPATITCTMSGSSALEEIN